MSTAFFDFFLFFAFYLHFLLFFPFLIRHTCLTDQIFEKKLTRDFAFKKKLPILPIVYEAKRGIKIRNKNYSFLCINNQKGHLFVYNYVTNKTYTYERRCP